MKKLKVGKRVRRVLIRVAISVAWSLLATGAVLLWRGWRARRALRV
jgi:hypothetical protein